MKKNAVKSASKPASPVVKASIATKPAAKSSAVKKVAKTTPAPVVPTAVEPKVAKTTKPTKKATAPKPKPAALPLPTVIVAAVDVGFGNSLSIRGDGAGLSWDKGIALECTSDTKWSIALPANGPVTFKFLINDTTWSAGEDYTVPAGASVELTPAF